MDDSFYQAVFHGDYEVLGVSLKPFSLWHQTLLQAINSPLLENADRCDVQDLLVAVRVFSCQFPEVPNLQPRLFDFLRKARFKKDGKKLEILATALAEYIKAHSSHPQFWRDTEESRGGGATAPEQVSTVLNLMRNGFSESDGWNMSLGRARWYEASMLEREGAKIRFAYEFEDDLEEMSEDEQYLQLVEDWGDEEAEKFWAKRNSVKVMEDELC